MKKLDELGRITIPKRLRDKYNLDNIDIIETENGLLIKSLEEQFSIKDYQMDLLRKLYFTIKDSMILDDTELREFKEICRISDIECPKCKEYMIITSDNGYKCINCGE